MIRRLLAIASTLLLLSLCLGTAAAWAWSETRSATIGWRGKAREDFLSISGGYVHYSICFARQGGFNNPHGWVGDTSPDPVDYKTIARRGRWTFYAGGIGFDHQHVSGQQYAYDGVLVPCWLMIATFAPLPVLRARRAYRTWTVARRRRGGACPACGYDLRASPGRCPECGCQSSPGQ